MLSEDNQEKSQIGAFSVITNHRIDLRLTFKAPTLALYLQGDAGSSAHCGDGDWPQQGDRERGSQGEEVQV